MSKRYTYRVRRGSDPKEIQRFELVKETPMFVTFLEPRRKWIGVDKWITEMDEAREAKDSHWANHYMTWDQAHKRLCGRWETIHNQAKLRVEESKRIVKELKTMEEPPK